MVKNQSRKKEVWEEGNSKRHTKKAESSFVTSGEEKLGRPPQHELLQACSVLIDSLIPLQLQSSDDTHKGFS